MGTLCILIREFCIELLPIVVFYTFILRIMQTNIERGRGICNCPNKFVWEYRFPLKIAVPPYFFKILGPKTPFQLLPFSLVDPSTF